MLATLRTCIIIHVHVHVLYISIIATHVLTVAPPIVVGAWSMAVLLWQHVEYLLLLLL